MGNKSKKKNRLSTKISLTKKGVRIEAEINK